MTLSARRPQACILDPAMPRYQSLLKNDSDTFRMKSGCVCLQPGEAVGEHVTDKREEVIVLLSGQARVMCEGGDPLTVTGPAVVYIPPQKRHDVHNIGRDVLRYVYAVTMSDQEEFAADEKKEVK